MTMDIIRIKKQLLNLMLKVRQVEEKIVQVYARDQMMRTPTHLSIGQEAVAAGLCLALRPEDQVFTGHRCHASYLAKGGDLDGMFAELCGRRSGVAGGRAGSAHLTDHGAHIYSSPILGAMIPVAVGAAMSFKMDGKDNVAVAVFGDATVEEGVFAESVNFAVTNQLPVLFLCENNLYSTHAPLSKRQPPSPIFKRAGPPEMPSRQIDGNDALGVYQTLVDVIESIRKTPMPAFVECMTYRVREHVGPMFDYDRGYRTKQEVDAWKAKCPLERLKQDLLTTGAMTSKEISVLEEQWSQRAQAAYQKALQSPWPGEEELLRNVY